jgi:hypothetical protein
MAEDIDSVISTAPALRFAFAIKAKVGPIQDLGQTARGHRRVVARYTIRSRSGALVYVQNEGLRVASPEILARMSKGEAVPVGSYHFRTAPRFETAEPSLKWMERPTFVGVAARAPDRVAIGFHEVL